MTKQRTDPDLQDVLEGAMQDLLYSFNCHRIGTIQSFDPSNQTATIQLTDKGVISNSDGSEQLITFSPLLQCPAIILKGASGGLTFPINEGDTCLVLFNDRDIDNWFEDGLPQRPNTLRAHEMSDAIALVGIRNGINKLTDYNNSATVINYLDTKISLGNKVEISNAAENLKSIIDELINVVTNLKTVDPISGELPIDAATAASLSALSTRVGDLLA